MNRCHLGGRLTRDPESRTTQGGTKMVNFSIAVNDYFQKDQDGKPKVYFFDCRAFGKTAELIESHFHKGDPVYIHCKAQVDSWDDKETGKARTRTVFVVESFDFPMVSKSDKVPQDTKPARAKPESKMPEYPATEEEDEEIPF